MEHFPTEQWIDFVREKGPKKRKEMQRHIDEQCPQCSKSMNAWRVVMAQVQQSNRTTPPQASVRAVKAGFALRNVVAFPSGKLDLATLQFDSDQQPLAAGMRSGSASARQLLYRSGSVCIDMRMEPTPRSESIVLVGQILDSMNPSHGLGGVPVSLLSKGDTVSRKRTNDNGEFDFGLELGRDMQLVFGIERTRTIVVAVPETSKRVM
jgi:hypothetical protein